MACLNDRNGQANIGIRLALLACLFLAAAFGQQDWTHYVRIGGYGGPTPSNIDRTIQNAAETNVFGIEIDNDPPGRYESFLDPAEKLENLRLAAARIHAAGNYTVAYICGTECITPNAPSKAHTMAKDHPDWLQRDIKGEPAIFGGGIAFWVAGGDEDAWVTPFAKDWMKLYLEHIRKIAATGVDGIYVDLPYWMSLYRGWGNRWASFDDHTVAAFKDKTGLNAKTDLKLGDFRDANFRKWIDFRFETITNFMRQVDATVKSVNPKCKTIAEIYAGIEDAVPVGTDVYELYGVVDTIAHEYELGGQSAGRSPLSWFQNMVGLHSFRAFAAPKPSWMLTYSWNGEKAVPPAEAMKNLAMAQSIAGVNTWDVRNHAMGGSNDFETRKLIFTWLKDHEKVFFLPRNPVHPIGVYFSPRTRNYFAREFVNAYRGALIALMQSHVEFQIVTPRTLANFRGAALILPDVRCLSKDELGLLKKYPKTLVVTGETGKYDDTGAELKANPLRIGNAGEKLARKKLLYFPGSPDADYSAALQKEFNDRAASGTVEQAAFESQRKAFIGKVLKAAAYKPAVRIEASPFLFSQVAEVGGKTHVFLANFKGLKSNQVAQQIPEKNVKVIFPRKGVVHVLPFLGGETTLTCQSCVIPEIDKGAVVWME